MKQKDNFIKWALPTAIILSIILIVLSVPIVYGIECDKYDYVKLIENKNGANPHTIYEICEPIGCPISSKLFTYQAYNLKGKVQTGINSYEKKSYYNKELEKTEYYWNEKPTDIFSFNNDISLLKGKRENNCYKIKVVGEWQSCEQKSVPGNFWSSEQFCKADNIICYNNNCYSEWIEWTWDSSNWAGIFSNTEDTTNITLTTDKAHIWPEDLQEGNWRFETNGSVEDSSGKGNDGVINGDILWVDGYVGKGYDFNKASCINTSRLLLSGLTDVSWGAWFNVEKQNADQWIAGEYLKHLRFKSNSRLNCNIYNDSSVAIYQDYNPGDITNAWHFGMCVYNQSGIHMFLDGEWVASGSWPGSGKSKTAGKHFGIGGAATTGIGCDNPSYFFNGTIDEVVVYNRSLSIIEIRANYNYMKSNYSSVGNLTLNPLSGIHWTNWTNASWVEKKDGTSQNITLQFRTSNDNSTWSSWSDNISNSYTSLNNTAKYIQFKTSMYTDNINITPYLESLTIEYENPLVWNVQEAHYDNNNNVKLTELFYANFHFNITHNDFIDYQNASFYWNSTTATYNTTTKTSIGSNATQFNATLTIPSVTKTDNYTFFWNITSQYSNGSTTYTTYNYVAHVENTGLTNCTEGNISNVAVLNFTLWDEQDINTLLYFDFEGTFVVWGKEETAGVNETFSFDINTSSKTIRFCMSPNGTSYRTNAIIRYTANDGTYSWRDYYLLNQTLNTTGNISQHDTALNLYALKTAKSNGITFVIQDSGGEPIEGYYIKVLKYDVGTDTHFTVAMDKTNYDGKGYIYLNKFDTLYRFIIQDYTTPKWVSSDFKVSTDKLYITITPVTFKDVWQTFDDVTFTLTNTTNAIIATFVKTSTAITDVCLEVWKYSMKETIQLCDTCSTSESATLTCNIGNENGTYTGTLYGIQSGSTILNVWDKIEVTKIFYDFQNKIGQYIGLFGAFLITGTLAAIGLFSPAISIILSIVGLIVSWSLGMLKITYGIIIAIVIVAAIIIAKMR